MTVPAAAEVADRPDTPRASYGLLPRRVTFVIVTGLLILGAVAWLVTVRQARSMSDMVGGLGQVGGRAPNDMTMPVFLGMWVGMMVAMMFPAVAPMVLAHRKISDRRGDGITPTVVFVAGYLTVWAVIGIVPLVAFLAFRDLAADAIHSLWLPVIAGVVLIISGAYQFTNWKALCLKACRTPLHFAMTHDFGGGSRSAFRAGVSHGAYCLGCCWALMSVLLVVGLMNLAWMAALALIFLAEKQWRHAIGLTRVVGTALILIGVVVIARPSLLPTLSGSSDTPHVSDMSPMQHMG